MTRSRCDEIQFTLIENSGHTFVNLGIIYYAQGDKKQTHHRYNKLISNLALGCELPHTEKRWVYIAHARCTVRVPINCKWIVRAINRQLSIHVEIVYFYHKKWRTRTLKRMNRAITLQWMLYSEIPKLKNFGDQCEVGWYVHFLA